MNKMILQKNRGSKNSLLKVSLVLLLLILFSMQVVALGIAPARKVITFEQGFKKTFIGLVINNEGKDLQLEISTDDPYKMVKLDVDFVEIKANEKEKMFKYTINIPKKLEHYGEVASIRVMEKGSSAGISSRLIVEFPIVIEPSQSVIEKNNSKEKEDSISDELVDEKNGMIEKKNVSYGETELKSGEKIEEKNVIENKSLELSTVKDKYESKSATDDSIKMMILLIVGLCFLLILVIAIKRRRE